MNGYLNLIFCPAIDLDLVVWWSFIGGIKTLAMFVALKNRGNFVGDKAQLLLHAQQLVALFAHQLVECFYGVFLKCELAFKIINTFAQVFHVLVFLIATIHLFIELPAFAKTRRRLT